MEEVVKYGVLMHEMIRRIPRGTSLLFLFTLVVHNFDGGICEKMSHTKVVLRVYNGIIYTNMLRIYNRTTHVKKNILDKKQFLIED